MDTKIYYKGDYKYRLHKKCQFYISIKPDELIAGVDRYVTLAPDGLMTFKRGYAWDGATGVRDTKTVLRASLGHDGLFQLFREGKLPRSLEHGANRLFRKHCIEDKMNRFRAWYMYVGLGKFAKSATLAKNVRKVMVAP